MRERPLGPAAAAVSAVGYGGMHLSIEGRPTEAQGVAVIHAALDAGVTLIDTADVYCLSDQDLGHNERLIALALRQWRGDRDRIIVATKGGSTRPDGRWERNGRPDHLRRACDRSLKALDVERIDLYQLHSPDPRVPIEESIGAIADLQGAGKVRWIGLSNVSVEQIERSQRVAPITTVQNRLSPFFRESLDGGVVEFCGEQGMGFLAYSPVGGGRLTRTIPSIPAVQAVAARHRASPHAVVLAWVLAQGATVIPIPSARTAEHVVDSAGASELELTAGDLDDIGAAEFSTA